MPRGKNAQSNIHGVNVNNECRFRTRNTEKSRKRHLSNPNAPDPYNDDDPPDSMPGDEDVVMDVEEGKDGEAEENRFLSRSKTCPHYRQLTASRIANLAYSTFVPNSNVDCCSVGGKNDIEDLVNFGVDPYVQKDIALYRAEATQSFGLSLRDANSRGRGRGCFIGNIKKDSAAGINGSLKAGDKILRVNGDDVTHLKSSTIANRIRNLSADPLILDISRGGSGTLSSGDGSYSSHSACPYYISQTLSKDADIIFAPYN